MTKNYATRLKCPYGDSEIWVTLRDREETLEQVLSTHWDFECPIHGVQREIPIQATEIIPSFAPRQRGVQPLGSGTRNSGQRRSKRVPLRVPIFIYGQARDKSSFREEAATVLVNAHGALLALTARVRPGETMLLVNKATQEEQECRIAYVGPRVQGKIQVGIAFKGSVSDFWKIDFPPPS